MTSRQPRYTVRTDGASRGNPGAAAIGVVITDEAGAVLRQLGRRIGRATNNEAEYLALIAGLEAALGLGATAIEARLDSELVIRHLKGRYRIRSPHLRPLYNRALALLRRFASVDMIAVPRAQNRNADALANAALDGTEIDYTRAPC